MVKATEIMQDVAFGELGFLSLLAVEGMSRSAFLSVTIFILYVLEVIHLVLPSRKRTCWCFYAESTDTGNSCARSDLGLPGQKLFPMLPEWKKCGIL